LRDEKLGGGGGSVAGAFDRLGTGSGASGAAVVCVLTSGAFGTGGAATSYTRDDSARTGRVPSVVGVAPGVVMDDPTGVPFIAPLFGIGAGPAGIAVRAAGVIASPIRAAGSAGYGLDVRPMPASDMPAVVVPDVIAPPGVVPPVIELPCIVPPGVAAGAPPATASGRLFHGWAVVDGALVLCMTVPPPPE
jgi:hypothetical protein